LYHAAITPEACPALVLNADYRPLSYYPLSLWSWQDSLKAVFLDRVNIVSEYDRVVRSPTQEFKLPSVISLKTYVKPSRNPAFTRFNVFLRDKFMCQYCGDHDDLTFDHLATCAKVVPCRAKPACSPCRNHLCHRLRSCTAMVGCFHRIICTRAGWIISTGIRNSIPDIFGRAYFWRAALNASAARPAQMMAFHPASDNPKIRMAG
jgi:hypothetical protein